jgi:hypothetical protein
VFEPGCQLNLFDEFADPGWQTEATVDVAPIAKYDGRSLPL